MQGTETDRRHGGIARDSDVPDLGHRAMAEVT